jgi:hypothetical protein
MTNRRLSFAAAGALSLATGVACSGGDTASKSNPTTDAGASDSGHHDDASNDAGNDAAHDTTADSPLPSDGGTTRWFRFVHPISNLGAAIEICVRPTSGEPPLAVPITQAEFPDGLPYGAATAFVAIGPELTTQQRAYFDVHRAPIDECPDFSGLSDAPASFVAFGMVVFNNPELHWFTSGPVGLVASPPGEPVALCGPSFAQPCTTDTAGVSWFWAAEDALNPTDPTKADVAVLSTLAGSLFATICWDPDGSGPAAAVLVSDLEQDGIATDHVTREPLTNGRVFVLNGGGSDCTGSAAPIAELTLPAAVVPAGGSSVIQAGSAGRIWLVGQVTNAPSSPNAKAKIVLLPGAPL